MLRLRKHLEHLHQCLLKDMVIQWKKKAEYVEYALYFLCFGT